MHQTCISCGVVLEVLVEWNGVKFLRRHVLNFHSASDMGFAGGCGDPNVNEKPP